MGEVVLADWHLHHQLLQVVSGDSLGVEEAKDVGHASLGIMEVSPRRLDYFHLRQLPSVQNIFKASPHCRTVLVVLVGEEIEVDEEAPRQMETPVFSNPLELCAGLTEGRVKIKT